MKTKKKSLKFILSNIMILFTLLIINVKQVFAETAIGTAEVEQATSNIKRVISSIAMPLGGIIIFATVVLVGIKMIVNANNPQKRAESIGSLAWICGGAVVLGLSLIISGIIINIATNNTGSLIGG